MYAIKHESGAYYNVCSVDGDVLDNVPVLFSSKKEAQSVFG